MCDIWTTEHCDLIIHNHCTRQTLISLTQIIFFEKVNSKLYY